MPESGMGSLFGLPPAVHGILFACFFWLIALSLGRRLARVFRLHSSEFTALEGSQVELVIGTGFLQLVPYTLAAAHALTASAVRVTVLLLSLLLLPDGVRVIA